MAQKKGGKAKGKAKPGGNSATKTTAGAKRGKGADDEGSPFLKLSAFMIREVRMHSIYL